MTDAEALEAENARLRRLLWTLAEAALAYDAAIQRAAAWGKPWTEGEALDVLYERWLALAREALGLAPEDADDGRP